MCANPLVLFATRALMAVAVKVVGLGGFLEECLVEELP